MSLAPKEPNNHDIEPSLYLPWSRGRLRIESVRMLSTRAAPPSHPRAAPATGRVASPSCAGARKADGGTRHVPRRRGHGSLRSPRLRRRCGKVHVVCVPVRLYERRRHAAHGCHVHGREWRRPLGGRLHSWLLWLFASPGDGGRTRGGGRRRWRRRRRRAAVRAMDAWTLTTTMLS